MKKLVKVVCAVLIVVVVMSYSISKIDNLNKNITLDFENSGTPEWVDIVGLNHLIDEITLDFENSGTPEWVDIVGLSNEKNEINLDFRNSGLPETIEFRRFSF